MAEDGHTPHFENTHQGVFPKTCTDDMFSLTPALWHQPPISGRSVAGKLTLNAIDKSIFHRRQSIIELAGDDRLPSVKPLQQTMSRTLKEFGKNYSG